MMKDDYRTRTIAPENADISLPMAIKRGAFGKCPRCGEGRLFEKFLKAFDRCAVCGLEFHHHRADDLPPYLAIFLVGHIVVGGYMAMESAVEWSLLAHMALWAPLTILLCVGLLQPLKGGVIGLQWSLGMHGFGEAGENEA